MINKTLLFTATTKSINRIILVLALLLASVNIASAALVPAISVLPSVNVEVGEEVYFSAMSTTYTPTPALLPKARYEWNFGDGYTIAYADVPSPWLSISPSGRAAVHYFMTPGNYTVTLTVSVWGTFNGGGVPIGNPLATGTTTTVVHVTGTAPVAGFEIQRAPFNNRTKQYLYIQIPVAYRAGTTQLKVSLISVAHGTSVLLTKNNLASEEKLLLDHTVLALDSYVLQAQLLDSGNNQISGGIWRDKFTRTTTTPTVTIDENNSFSFNGSLFFPIGPFMTDVGWIPTYVSDASINMLYTQGYYTAATPTTWGNYLDTANSNNVVAIGPGKGDYALDWAATPEVNRWRFNNNIDKMTAYISANKTKPALFAWGWVDEINIGGANEKVYAPVAAAWGYVSHINDANHPSFNTFYGYDWGNSYATAPSIYDYLGSAPLFGGKKWVQDAIPFDIYPIHFRLDINTATKGPYAAYLFDVGRIQAYNKNLVPLIPAIVPCDAQATDEPLNPQTDAQVYLECWMNVIHGAKAILWFEFFDMDNTGRWTAMKKFSDQMAILTPVVLGPEPTKTVTRTDQANAALNRVDTMIRESGGVVYVFAARITEPAPITGSLYQGVEPDSITPTFTVSGLTGSNTVTVYGENRTVSLTDGKFTDTFVKNSVHIYKIVTLRPPSNLRVH